ncbi:hypothetical protein BGX23_003419 [Mortierella sp. AD031]|nr:hypothetical protein BGX23_003419 [Mortierella sp. AD031]
MEDVSPLYIVDTLASLKDLSALENTYLPIDRILGLESYTTSFALSESNTSTQTSPRLRHAGFKDINAYRDLLLLLRHAPNLESLHLGGIAGLGSVTPAEAAVIIGDTPSRLTVFRLDMRGHSYDFNMDRVFSWMPHLTTMTTHQLLPSMARSLSTFCTSLETVCEPHKAPIFGTREQATPPTTPALDLLLKHCPTLKKFDGIRHALSGQIWEEPWACQGLRYLRCRILGVQRLSCRDQQRYDAMVCAESGIQSEDEDDSRVAGLHRDSVEQQKIIYGRLATLTKLCVLDLGADPASDTLELTLESGLGLLGALKELKVFGFEGVDHRIEERELRWMASSWPRLKVMRGLHSVKLTRVKSRPDDETTYLRRYIQKLRPRVKHKKVTP